MSISNWIRDKTTSLRVGASVHTVNNGNLINSVVIRYKDLYFDITVDAETQLPTGDFGWSTDPTMNPTVAIRDIWVASPPTERLGLDK